jgi:ApbE superfamily uncharacterized protein (UPF0280 family)
MGVAGVETIAQNDDNAGNICGSARQIGHSLLNGIASVASIDTAKTADMDVLSKHWNFCPRNNGSNVAARRTRWKL